MINSKILYFIETSPLKEQIFNSYMGEAVMLWNEEWTAQAVDNWQMKQERCGETSTWEVHPVFLAVYLQQKWLEMVRCN